MILLSEVIRCPIGSLIMDCRNRIRLSAPIVRYMSNEPILVLKLLLSLVCEVTSRSGDEEHVIYHPWFFAENR